MTAALPLELRPRCGLIVSGQTRDGVLGQARRAEALGFDSLWAGDHVSFHVPLVDSLSLLSFVAGATERVQLGTAVYLLPLRHPTHVAKSAAALDLLSNGRLVFGIGVGGEYPPEFEASGVRVEDRGSRMDEAIPLLRRFWTEERVAHQGRHFRFGPVTLAPRPARPGGPPLWIGGRAPAAMRRAGRLGDGYISTMTAAERYRANLDAIGAAAGEAGRRIESFGTGALLFTVLGKREEAVARAAALLGTIYRRDFKDAAPRYALCGEPADCLETMRRFADAGVRHFVLAPLMDPTELMERAAAEILPEVPGLLR